VREAPEALELAARAVRAAEGDEMDALVHRERSGLARFAASAVHQPTLVEDASVTIRVVRDGKVGAVSTNRLDDDGLRAAARRAGEAAASGRPDPSFPGLAPPAAVPDVQGWDEETDALDPGAIAAHAWTAIEAAAPLELYGYFTSGLTELAVASSTGVSVSQAMTDATVLALAADETRSGFAEASAWRVGELDPAATAREAAETAARTKDAGGLEPGTYRAVLSPYAFGELLLYFGYSSLGALALLEGRSFLTGRLGERVFDERLTLADHGQDPRGLPKAFDFEGVPKQRVALVEAGVARDVVWDRRTARREGRESTGHALDATSQAHGPLPFNLSVEPGDATVEQLADLVGDGIYVTRLHYVNIVDAREGLLTGMTRDGTFRIENGNVTRPLVNLRFTTSVPALLERLPGLGAEATLVNGSDFYDARYPFGTLVPPVATERFTIVGTGSEPGL
jgi:PmbA protein